MTVWFAVPSKRPRQEAMTALITWRGKGYKTSVFRDTGDDSLDVDLTITGSYDGYAKAVNQLCCKIMEIDLDADWIVTGGDDVLPDLAHDAGEIGVECSRYFKSTLGVMQPTGDRYMEDKSGKCAAERVCVSPWLGREWCARAYEGCGPLCEEYYHFFVDEDLHNAAERLGLLWHRRDLNQHHQHWARDGGQRPEFLRRAEAGWTEAKALFDGRKAAGFPGSGLL